MEEYISVATGLRDRGRASVTFVRDRGRASVTFGEGNGIITMTFEDLLARDGSLVYRTKGVSMEPMLRQDRDLVTIQVPETRLTSVQKEFPHLKAKLRWWDEFWKCTLRFY